MKILHIIESFDGQATESWLLELLRYAREQGATDEWHFFEIACDEGGDPDRVRALGGEVFRSAYSLKRPYRLLRELRRVVRTGRFDVVHSHHDVMSGFYFLALIGLTDVLRVTHVHNCAADVPVRAGIRGTAVRICFRALTNILSHVVAGVSAQALHSVVFPSRRGRTAIVPCSLAQRKDVTRAGFRESSGIGAEVKLILFAGRLSAYKNPLFAADLVQLLRAQGVNAALILAGEGPLTGQLIERKCGGESIYLLGWRDDLLAVMGECDLLLCPSRDTPPEGLGLVVVEAQSTGLPVVASASFPSDVIISEENAARMQLAAGVTAWAEKVVHLLAIGKLDAAVAEERIKRSAFSTRASYEALMALYA